MLGVLCARPKPWIIASLTALIHGSAVSHHYRVAACPVTLAGCLAGGPQTRRQHSSACRIGRGHAIAAASIWHAILPSGGVYRRPAFHLEHMKGDGSWNVACDARPARWLHRPDSAWLLFGVCACLAAPLECADVTPTVAVGNEVQDLAIDTIVSKMNDDSSANYRVTGVTADGRCLFRAIAHVACLRNGEEAPDEIRQRELADDLRAQVVDELLKRRKETEWFIEGDFDAYVERIQQPYVWGGEPELIMASHVLKTPISVFMIDRSSGSLAKIANYGEEYQNGKISPITILFHGYGHYDILEAISEPNYQRAEAKAY
ncbi:hypothetical protein NMG60_11020265 [Bertholletia excelsa]